MGRRNGDTSVRVRKGLHAAETTTSLLAEWTFLRGHGGRAEWRIARTLKAPPAYAPRIFTCLVKFGCRPAQATANHSSVDQRFQMYSENVAAETETFPHLFKNQPGKTAQVNPSRTQGDPAK